jgi:hypothetical protein
VKVSVDGVALPAGSIKPGENAFELAFALPESLSAKTEMNVTVEVARTFRPAADPRELALAFGTFEVR